MFIHNASAQWAEGVLSDVADITMGQSPKGDTYNEEGIGTVFFQGRGEFGFRFPTRRLFTTDPKRMAQSNDVLMSVRALLHRSWSWSNPFKGQSSVFCVIHSVLSQRETGYV